MFLNFVLFVSFVVEYSSPLNLEKLFLKPISILPVRR